MARSPEAGAVERRIPRREHPIEHRPCHLRKAGKEVVVADRERRHAVDGIRNDRSAGGEFGHQHAVRVGGGAELRFELRDRDRMPLERHAEGERRGLPRVVVGRRADAAEGEDEIAAAERIAEGGGERIAIVTLVARPGEPESARGKRLDDMGEVTILALARQNLVADDERADAGWGHVWNGIGRGAGCAGHLLRGSRRRQLIWGGSVSANDAIMLPKARSMSGAASTRRARSVRNRSASSSAFIDNAFRPCRFVNR